MTLRDAQRFFRWYSIGYFACGLYEVLSPTRGLDNYSILAKTFAEYHVRRWILYYAPFSQVRSAPCTQVHLIASSQVNLITCLLIAFDSILHVHSTPWLQLRSMPATLDCTLPDPDRSKNKQIAAARELLNGFTI